MGEAKVAKRRKPGKLSRVAQAERDGICFRLRLAGWSLAAVAEEVGLQSPSSASRAFKRHLESLGPLLGALEGRALAVLRLERLLRAVWDKAILGQGQELRRATELVREIAKLTGAYPPSKTAAKVVVERSTTPLDDLPIEQLAAVGMALDTLDEDAVVFLRERGLIDEEADV